MSSIDPSKPTSGRAYTADVRENFRIAKEELDAFSNTSSTDSGDALIGVKLDATGSVARTQHSKNADVVSVKDFGAVLDNVTDDSAAFTLAMAAASKVLVPYTSTGAKLSSGISVPAGVELIMDLGMVLKPSADMAYVVNVHAGGWFDGRIDVSGVSFTGVAVDFDGDDNSDTVPFRLHTRSGGRAILVGGTTGTAVKLHADGAANARIMGVEFDARIYGFENGYWIRQTSADLSKFVNNCLLSAICSETLTPLKMESSHANSYGVDRHFIRIEVQPKSSTTVPAFIICGQGSEWDLTPWDWDTVVGTSPYAVTIAAATRHSKLTVYADRTYIQNNSTDDSLKILNLTDYLTAGGVRSIRSDGLFKFPGSSPLIDNNKFYKAYLANGTTDRNILGFNTSDDLVIQGSAVAGDNIILDAPNSTGIYAFRLNGGNVAFLGPSTGLQMQSKRIQGAQGAAVASASNLSLGLDGNRFQITGTTTIDRIANSSWQGGAIVTLHFQGSLTVTHNAAPSGVNHPIMLAGAANFSATANDQLVLQYDSTDSKWYEIARTVI